MSLLLGHVVYYSISGVLLAQLLDGTERMMAANMAMPEDLNVSELDKEEEEEDPGTANVSGPCLVWARHWMWCLVGWCMKHLQQNQSVFNALELPPFLVPMQPICVQPLSPPTHCLYVGATCWWTICCVLSKEWLSHGCTFGMYCYGIGPMPAVVGTDSRGSGGSPPSWVCRWSLRRWACRTKCPVHKIPGGQCASVWLFSWGREVDLYLQGGGEEVAHATFADIRINTLIYSAG